jgi:putative ABC transport system permease protein
MSLPIAGADWNSIFIVGDQPVPPRGELPASAFLPVSDDYFKTLGMRLVAGRLFNRGDNGGTFHVAVVNEAFARRFWPNGSALGKRIKQGWPEWQTPWREIVGVVNDVKYEGVTYDTPLQAYLPLRQESTGSLALVARTAGDAPTLVRPLEHVIQSFDGDVPVYDVRTMRQWLDNAVARERISMVILAVFAVVALVLAGVGLYGVISHGVTERTHEIGVRLALGADRAEVIRMFVGQGLVVAAAGVVIGLAGALGLSRFIQTLLFQVTATDPLTLAVVVVTLLLVSIAACYIPARRATRVDPTVALRQ